MRTTQNIENFIPTLNSLLGLKNSPKWVVIRFMINISLSIEDNIDVKIPETFDGKEYSLVQITGLNKDEDDVTEIYKRIIESYEKENIINNKDLEHRLEFHTLRGFTILNSSLKQTSQIYDFLLHEFF